MESFPVYRLDRKKKTKTRIGTIVERRKGERGSNLVGLLRIVKKTFDSSEGDTIHVQTLAVSRELPGIWLENTLLFHLRDVENYLRAHRKEKLAIA